MAMIFLESADIHSLTLAVYFSISLADTGFGHKHKNGMNFTEDNKDHKYPRDQKSKHEGTSSTTKTCVLYKILQYTVKTVDPVSI